MKIIHQNGYSVEERVMYRVNVYKNLLECAKALVGAYSQFSVEPSSEIGRDYVDYLLGYNIESDPNIQLEPRVGDAITYLWKDPCTTDVMEHQNEFYMMDSAP
jgi:guanine nucleotide-binding protein G(i) subunit alpha